VVSAIAIWAIIGVLSTRYALRPWDVTHQREFTLAQETRDLLKRVKQPLRFTALFGRAGDVRQHVLEEVESLIALFRLENRLVEYRRIDPDRDPAATYDLLSRLKRDNDPQRTRDSVVLEYGSEAQNRSAIVPLSRIASGEMIREGRKLVLHEKSFEGEAALASAILNLIEDEEPKIYFTAGHGELDLENPNNDGMQYAKGALREEKVQVDALFLLEKDKIPDDAAAIAIAGPVEPFDVQEIAKIEKYLERGGGLFVAIGPRRHTGLEPMLARFGVELGQDIVVDPSNKRAGRTPADLIVRKVGNHPIVSSLATSTIEDPLTRSVRRVPGNTNLPPRLQRAELLLSSDKSWGETDFSQFPKAVRNPEAGDAMGPLCLAMAATVGPDASDPSKMSQGGVRIAVYGSRDIFTNYWLTRAPANADLLQNTMNWLAKRDRLANVRPRSTDLRLLTLSEEQAQRLALAAYAGVPSLFLLAGILIWWSRRS
jgi:ABC-type uncharacterized transport system involved in gliding motility auxiliary subunit